MANLSITTLCNQTCRYCFARAAFDEQRSKVTHVSALTFQKALDFLKRSGIEDARLLGGEPTQHPDFIQMADMVQERGLRPLVFSNGLMPEATIRYLEEAPDSFSVLINITAFEESSQEKRKLQTSVLRRLGSRVSLGMNIDDPMVQYDFVLELFERFNLARIVRLGLAHPSLRGNNHFLHPRYYAEAGSRLARFAAHAREGGVELKLDCGFVACMFSPEELEALGDAVEHVGSRCNPILDILPDGEVVSCYPLAGFHREPLPDHHDASWLRARFVERLKPFDSLGVLRQCSSCAFKDDDKCNGGCRAAAMRRLRHSSFTFVCS
jgi:radical SAM protein with 4Fe4S-binding SPASM domain